MENKKIVLLLDSIGSGGVRTFLFQLLSIHVHKQIQPTIALEKAQLSLSLKEYCDTHKINIYFTAERKENRKSPIYSLMHDIKVFRKLIKDLQPQLILTSLGTPRVNFAGFLFSVPFIYYLHTYPEIQGWRYRFIDYIPKFFANDKQHFVTVSEFSKKKIVDAFKAKNHCVDVIYNKVSMDVTGKNKLNSNFVLTVGHVEHHKNPETWYLVAKKVLEKMPIAQFVWVGEGRLLEEYRDKVRMDGLMKSIKFIGQSTDVDQFYQEANIYFHPSLTESQGISILEAMSHSLPCVASSVGGIPESVIDNETGFMFEPKDIEGFSDKIITLLLDNELSVELGAKGRERVEYHFHMDKQGEEIWDLYSKALA